MKMKHKKADRGPWNNGLLDREAGQRLLEEGCENNGKTVFGSKKVRVKHGKGQRVEGQK